MAINNFKPMRDDSRGNKIENNLQAELGFAMRDLYNTKNVPVPYANYPLGSNLGAALSAENVSNKQGHTWEIHSIPGIAVINFVPVIAASKGEEKPITHTFFENLRREMLSVYTGAKNFQASDLHVVSTTMMLLRMYISMVEKTFDVYFAVASGNNKYTDPHALIKSLPWSEVDIDGGLVRFDGAENYVAPLDLNMAITVWNRDVIQKLNQIKWFKEVFPGENRWASLVEGFYKDCDEDSEYCQIYTMFPDWIYDIEIDSSKSPHTWSFTPQRFEWLANRNKVDEPSLMHFISYIADIVDLMIADEDFVNIEQSVEAILMKDKNTSIPAERLNFALYPVIGRTIELKYDADKLIAWHNATICNRVTPDAAIQNPLEGTLRQTFTVMNALDAGTDAPGVQVMNANKVINLPCINPSREQIINAMQWTIVREPSLSEQDYKKFPCELLGTDYVSSVFTVWGVWENGKFRYSKDYYTGAIACPYFEGNAAATHYGTWSHTIAWGMRNMALAQNFKAFPIQYILQIHVNEDGTTQVPHCIGISAELEVPYIANYSTIASMREQFVRNFYGYPMNMAEESIGTFDLVSGASTSTTSTPSATNGLVSPELNNDAGGNANTILTEGGSESAPTTNSGSKRSKQTSRSKNFKNQKRSQK